MSAESAPRRTVAACSVVGRESCDRAAAVWMIQLSLLRFCLALKISSGSYKGTRRRTSALVSLLCSVLWKGGLRGVGIGWSRLMRAGSEVGDFSYSKAWRRPDVAISDGSCPIRGILDNHFHSVGRPRVIASSSQSIAIASVPVSINQSLLKSGINGMVVP